MSHGTCSYICMYIYVVADSVMLQSYLHDFYNIFLKIKHKLYKALGSAPAKETSAYAPVLVVSSIHAAS